MSRNFEVLYQETTRAAAIRLAAVHRAPANATASARDHCAEVEKEILKLVRQVFVLPVATQAPDVVAFCGVEKGVGCSWVCARASEVLADQVPGRVCVIDANLRSPSLHEHFRVENGTGFSDAMNESRPVGDFLRPTWISKLWLMTSGALGSGPDGALNPARLRARFEELRAEFDYLLIDAPPMSSPADAALLGQLTDGVVLVVGSSSTRREPARVAKESLEAARVPVLGAVLNRRTYPIPEALYQIL
jgi:capsular exopolysaccharide synthesis family protein